MSRKTEQRQAILDALRESDRAVTAQELHGQLDGVGLATVYRNLQRLGDAGGARTPRGPQCEAGVPHVRGRAPPPPELPLVRAGGAGARLPARRLGPLGCVGPRVLAGGAPR